ncbi:MAG TPA: hypothetical protein VEH07_03635 [Alphaproteobacteria bacterium]|nr:hypothetical protein [Alphaproteobacteria bacterium]
MATEARAFEYAMGLFAVVIGLAVTDIATSFHRLIRAKHYVRWDPLALAAAFYTLCMAVYMWFDIWGVRNFAITRQFFFYLGLVIELFILFLASAASLPDEAEEAIDLRVYYADNRRHFWLLITLFQAGYAGFGFYFVLIEPADYPLSVLIFLRALMCAPTLISLVLMLNGSRWVHYIGVGLLFIIMVLHYGPAQIN